MSIKHNPLTAFLARTYFDLQTQKLEKLIFTATTGRSGTQTLARLFSCIPDCVAKHEPYPIMNGEILEAASYNNIQMVDRNYRWIKAINIRRAAAGHRYYLEANHLFIKTFIRQVVADFPGRVQVIHLVRPPVEVAMSIYRLQDYPGTDEGNLWWLDYRAPSNRIKIAELLDADREFSRPFYKALWYWFEIEARIRDWKKMFPSILFVRFETDWLNDKNRIFELMDQLKMVYQREAIEAWPASKEHQREHQKRVEALSPEESRKMLERFEELLFTKRFKEDLPFSA